ncbi:hypothetical protein E2C01_090380 [Portunus trituberculatus]|uniref:Uncharacterized protein n=1 Tax=Portunus trituberculatus TaxID=210409 RepID=A0A5B7JBA4_PORTR|nr:hypothetical protein [Portunus trituberculatus]
MNRVSSQGGMGPR